MLIYFRAINWILAGLFSPPSSEYARLLSSGPVLNPVAQALSFSLLTRKGPLVFTSLNAVIEWLWGRGSSRPVAEETRGLAERDVGGSSPLYRGTRTTREARKRRGKSDSVTIIESTAAIIFKHVV